VCSTTSRRCESFTDLPLAFSSEARTVEDMLAAFWAPESLAGENAYLCATCQRKQPALQSARIAKAPEYLQVTLKRFRYDFEKDTRVKIMTDVAIDPVITVPLADDSSCTYQLYAAVIHSGLSAGHGHYYSIGRESNTGTDGRWYLFNDSTVSPSSLAYLSKVTTTFSSDVPYILFYHRMRALGGGAGACAATLNASDQDNDHDI
jgi:ubiquitin C-terminal hydrolase